MIELWLFFALAAMLIRGAYSFSVKAATELKLNYSLMVLLSTLLAFIVSLFFFSFEIPTKEIVFFAFGIAAFHYIVMRLFFIILENASSSLVFITYRTVTAAVVIILGAIFFQELLSVQQIFGMILGVITFVLLLDKKDVPKKHANLTLAIIFLFICIILMAITNVTNKYLSTTNVLLDAFFPAYFLFLFLFSLLNSCVDYKKTFVFTDFTNKWFYFFMTLFSLSYVFSYYFFMLAFANGGYLAVVYKIYSFEIVIPIVLSIIFYKERLTARKAVAFGLTIISILLLT